MENIIITTLSSEELKNLINDAVNDALIKFKMKSNEIITNGDKLMTISETAEFLHVQKQTLYSYVSKGIIPHNKRAGRLYFSYNDLVEWVKGSTKKINDL
jgi:excisionase family DNA binding protein